MADDLRTRIAAAIMHACHGVYLDDAVNAADKVIRELDLGIPCAATGCRMRQIARRHADKSEGLTDG